MMLEPNHIQKGNYILIPIQDILTPQDGRMCFANRWWIITKNHEVIFFKNYNNPQCNTDNRVASRLCEICEDAITIEFITMAYVPFDWRPYK